MKLLFDENLSFKLYRQLGDLFPASSQVRLLGLERAHCELDRHQTSATHCRSRQQTAAMSMLRGTNRKTHAANFPMQ
jgi:Domain of unknown function (DUF5615)